MCIQIGVYKNVYMYFMGVVSLYKIYILIIINV